MGQTTEAIVQNATGLWDQVSAFGVSLLEPYRLWQVAILLVLALVAQGLALLIRPRFEDWLRGKSGLKMWQMRLLLLIRNRVRGLLQFCGASRTGRWAGRMVQPQNFTRGVLKKGDMADAIAAVKNGTL